MPARRTRSTALTALTALVAAVAGSWALAPTAHAVPVADHDMPFPCGQQWTGSTRSQHSPSIHAVDWNRPDDLGDPVVASAPGRVTIAQPSGSTGYGRYVVVDHGAGESTLYAHLQGVAVRTGQTVDQGSLVGYVGSSGASSSAHLHYEQRADRVLQPAWFDGAAFTYGTTQASRNCVDVPMAANVVGDARAEVAVFRRVASARFLVRREGRRPLRLVIGTASDEPVLGDWDGDGRADPGVRRGSTGRFSLRTPAGTTQVALGVSSDRGIAGDWDGDGAWEVGVHRAQAGQFLLRSAGGVVTTVALGDVDDLPLTGDWNGDRVTDVGVYDPGSSTFTLRYADDHGLVWTTAVTYGSPGQLPVTGDWDGNGRTEVGVWDPATATFSRRVAPSATAPEARTAVLRFGRPR